MERMDVRFCSMDSGVRPRSDEERVKSGAWMCSDMDSAVRVWTDQISECVR
jgi:hypothetical protein